MTVTDLKFTKTAFQVTQLTKLQVSPVVLKGRQQQLIAPAVHAAKSSGLQQRAARLKSIKATHCSRFQCIIPFILQLQQPSQV
jgi:hypothetical protein